MCVCVCVCVCVHWLGKRTILFRFFTHTVYSVHNIPFTLLVTKGIGLAHSLLQCSRRTGQLGVAVCMHSDYVCGLSILSMYTVYI